MAPCEQTNKLLNNLAQENPPTAPCFRAMITNKRQVLEYTTNGSDGYHNGDSLLSSFKPSRDEISAAHLDFVGQAPKWSREDLRKEIRKSPGWFLEKTGFQEFTVLHTASTRWDPSLAPVFRHLMEHLPQLYLKEDSVGQSILEVAYSKQGSASFVSFFAAEYPEQTILLVEQNWRVLKWLYAPVKDPLLWERILARVRDSLVKQDKTQPRNTLLHDIIHDAHPAHWRYSNTYRMEPGDYDWVLRFLKQLTDACGGLLDATNSSGLTAYQKHMAKLEQSIELGLANIEQHLQLLFASRKQIQEPRGKQTAGHIRPRRLPFRGTLEEVQEQVEEYEKVRETYPRFLRDLATLLEQQTELHERRSAEAELAELLAAGCRGNR